jgi:hypothetical protein
MINFIKERADIYIDDPAFTFANIGASHQHSLLRTVPGSIAVTVQTKSSVEFVR